MARCLLALGSNLGNRQAILARSCAEIAALPGCQLLARSGWHATTPIGGGDGQEAFLNGALLVETTLQPDALARALQGIEIRLGRERIVRWDARTIDIDLLLYSSTTISTRDLIVPHPRMAFRLFVLEPAVEIAGQMLHPSSGWTLSGLLAHLRNSPRYVVVTAAEQPIADWLVVHLCQTLGCTTGPRVDGDVGVDGKSIVHDNIVNTLDTGDLHSSRGEKLSLRRSGQPPVVATMCPAALHALASSTSTGTTLTGRGGKKKDGTRPALVIAIATVKLQELRDVARSIAGTAGGAVDPEVPQSMPTEWLESQEFNGMGLGPLASITAEDPATVLQEALAAVRCVWPDIESPPAGGQ